MEEGVSKTILRPETLGIGAFWMKTTSLQESQGDETFNNSGFLKAAVQGRLVPSWGRFEFLPFTCMYLQHDE